ncbi:MAG: PAS domain-containing protein, partial [Anaerolineae bacterium]|nr:PAS domain-containing protein [Anaerolineae bacterium]
RCRIFLNANGVLQGTHGIDQYGELSDEHALCITDSAHWIARISEAARSGANWIAIADADFEWDAPPAASSGWIALTPLRSGDRLIGVFVNDCSSSECALDPEIQETVAVFGSLLALIIEQKRAKLAAASTAPGDLFTRLIHASPMPIVVIALHDNVFLDVNARYLELMGYTRDELIGRSLSDSSMPLSPEETERIAAALRGKTTVRDFETMLRTRSGEMRSVRLFVERVQLNDRTCVVAMIDDFTDRLHAEKALSEGRSLLRTVIDTLPDYIFAKDLNGRFIMSNAAHARAANVLDPDAFIGKEASDFFPEDLAAQFDADDREVLRTGTPSLNMERMTQNGANNPIIVSTTKVPLRDPHGNIVGLVGISRDITAYKRAQEALQKAHDGLEERVAQRTAELLEANALLKQQIIERQQAQEALAAERNLLQTLIDNLPHAIYAKDAQAHIIISNNFNALMMGARSTEAVIGKTDFDFFPKAMAEKYYANDMAVLRTGQPLINNEEMFPALGQYLMTSKFPLYNSRGAIIGLVGVGLDITERKRAEEALRQAHDQLEQRVEERTAELRVANEEVKRFAYIVSHDLRAPLVNIKGFSSELKLSLAVIEDALKSTSPHLNEADAARVAQALDQDIPEALGFIRASVERMNYLINAILKFSRLGERTLQLESIQTADLVRTIIRSLGHQIAAHKTSITIGDLPDIVADRPVMEQVFGNILSNAVLYLDPARAGEIRITGENMAGETVFHIQDNGRGIADDDRGKVFELFRRGSDVSAPGEGMGLAYVQALIRRHEGRIWFDSQPGIGTTFSFAIPYREIEELVHA